MIAHKLAALTFPSMGKVAERSEAGRGVAVSFTANLMRQRPHRQRTRPLSLASLDSSPIEGELALIATRFAL